MPPQYTDHADQVIEKGTSLRLKILGVKPDVAAINAIGTIKEDFLGYVTRPLDAIACANRDFMQPLVTRNDSNHIPYDLGASIPIFFTLLFFLHQKYAKVTYLRWRCRLRNLKRGNGRIPEALRALTAIAWTAFRNRMPNNGHEVPRPFLVVVS